MRLSSILFACLAPALALCTPSGEVDRRRLPPCGVENRPCRCPRGATFKNLTTFGVIGAPAVEVRNIMGKFFDVQYQGGLTPFETTGQDGVPGATRTFNFSGPAGYFQIREVLGAYEEYPDGSFYSMMMQDPSTPVIPIPGGGTYMGWWGEIIGQQTLIANETVVAWTNWRCEVGFTFAADISHENGIRNASAVIDAAGRHTGVDIDAFSIWYEVRQD
ncbi:hypothetical protein MFIFM68171_06819 [Madurella fahalii]|uniref:Uncharacterized protein n=1 Tax=Madurella fahalii TaxID=1157608 RepID=A0ABQ0GFU3_9PEZI